MNAVALPPRQLTDLFLLVCALEVEGSDIAARRNLALAQLNNVHPVGDFFPNILVVVQHVTVLIDITQFHGLTQTDRTRVRLFLSGDHAEQRGFTGPVRANNTNDPAWWQFEAEIFHQHLAVIGFAEAFGFDHDTPQARAWRDNDLGSCIGLFSLFGFAHQLVIGGNTRLRFRLATPRRGADPFAFLGDVAHAGFLFPTFLLQTLLLLFQPGGIVAFIRNATPAVQFQNPAGHIVQEVAIVGYHNDGTGIVGQETLQPGNTFGV